MPTDVPLADLLRRQKVLPLFTSGDPVAGLAVLEALHHGGLRIVEFTNRSAGALDVFRQMAAEAAERLPDLVLGAGTIMDTSQAAAFVAAGARFVVAPHLDAETGRWCRERGIAWCPGTGTVSEMVEATRLGAEVVKVFPADALGGPAFIKAVRGPCPWLKAMPSGGVTLEADNLRAWFAAGAHCVGMGSNLVAAEMLRAGSFAELTDRARRLVAVLAEIG